jgi:urease accessory protein
MIRVDRVLGNWHDDPDLARRWGIAAHEGRLETLALPAAMAERRRLRVTTDAGTDIGISLGEGGQLRDGDVLVDDEAGPFVAVAMESEQAVSFRCDLSLTPAAAFATGVLLGHLLGMQHWNFRLAEDQCIVPVTDWHDVSTVLNSHPVNGVTYEFSGGD